MIINYTPDRGPHEPVSNIKIARIILYPSYLEWLLAYDYEYESDTKVMETVKIRSSSLIPKSGIFIDRTYYKEKDNDIPMIVIDSPSMDRYALIWA